MELRRERFKSDASLDIESENNDPLFNTFHNQNINLCIKEKDYEEQISYPSSSSSDDIDNENILKKCGSYDDLVEAQNFHIQEMNLIESCKYQEITEMNNEEIIKKYYNIENIPIIEVDYNEKYNVKYLTHIANFYSIPKCKKNIKKNELIQMIVLYETNENNIQNVLKRIRYFEVLELLKKDKYLTSFIMFP